MLNKIKSLVVLSSKTPFSLTVTDCNSNVIATRNITTSTSSFCLTTSLCCIRLLAKYQNQTIIKTIPLTNCKCQRVTASFNFQTTQPTTQTFTLTDANYGLPVANATLNFQQT